VEETPSPTIKTLVIIVKALKVDIKDLFQKGD
jgi:hypothetical protein